MRTKERRMHARATEEIKQHFSISTCPTKKNKIYCKDQFSTCRLPHAVYIHSVKQSKMLKKDKMRTGKKKEYLIRTDSDKFQGRTNKCCRCGCGPSLDIRKGKSRKRREGNRKRLYQDHKYICSNC